jgi:hypothetical protein
MKGLDQYNFSNLLFKNTSKWHPEVSDQTRAWSPSRGPHLPHALHPSNAPPPSLKNPPPCNWERGIAPNLSEIEGDQSIPVCGRCYDFCEPNKIGCCSSKGNSWVFWTSYRASHQPVEKEVFLIDCNGVNLQEILEGFSASVKSFPCTT